ncbi:MAG: hypothetical protein QF704_15195 [Anaerolineales bacterium]|nr:hypothetical protein [Anaerolineales bacterium]
MNQLQGVTEHKLVDVDNGHALMAISVLRRRSSAMDLKSMEMLVGGLIVLMALTKSLRCVVKKGSIQVRFALVLRHPANKVSGNAGMGNVLVQVINATDLKQQVHHHGEMTARMDQMRTLLPAVRLLENILEVKEILLVNADQTIFLVLIFTHTIFLREFTIFTIS